MTRFFLGIALLLLAVIAAISMIGGRAVLWLHPAFMAFLLVGLVPFFALLSIWSATEIGKACKAAFHSSTDAENIAGHVALWKALEYFFYAAGVMACLAGFIITFSLLDSDLGKLGARLAASLVAPFYGILLAMIARVLRIRVEQSKRLR